MRNFMIAAVAALAIAAGPASVYAAPCKHAKGRFIKCPAPVAAPGKIAKAKPTPAKAAAAKPAATGREAPCRDARGRFAKCK